MKKERLAMSDEQRERQLIAEQIEKAAAEQGDAEPDSPPPEEDRELKREEGAEKVVLNISLSKPTPVVSSSSASTGSKLNPLKPGNALKMGNPLKAANPLKQPNVFKTAVASSSKGEGSSNDKKRPMSAAEALILEDQERKRRRMERESA